ncbi:MAG TPA: PecA family PE domain-processing aspartic protease, partial [Mycobacterium sp.]|nr:PecA family PE domain-processing aspartic protease [Mycobacterium sp.]
ATGDSGTGAYSGGLTYNYNVYDTTVSFGNGITTGTTQVNIVTDASTDNFEQFLAGNGVVGVLGIGANAVGPGPSLVTAALPGELGDGVYIDEKHGLLVFGPNPLPARVTLSGSPYANVTMTAGDGSTYTGYLIIDSGGVYGTVWSSSLAAGTKVTVKTPDGTTLYSYTTQACTTAGNACTSATSSAPNSGYYPFKKYAMYIGYSTPLGTTSFDL